ncbi:hypothetical protein ACW6QP_06890 [Salegentibacter sp. HM20]
MIYSVFSNKHLIFIGLFLISTCSLSAQDFEKFFLEGSTVAKFSIGDKTRENIQYRENVNVNVPDRSRFDSMVIGLNFSINYRLSEHFSSGLGTGINAVMNQRHPGVNREHYDNILFPVFIKLRYETALSETWSFLSDLDAGYQFSDFRYGRSPEGYEFIEKGGYLAALDFGIGKDFGKYKPMLKLGYEINQFRNETSLGWMDASLQFDDKVEYNTYFHMIRLSLSMQF